MLLNCGVGEDSWESLGLHGDPTNPTKPILKEISPGCSLEGLMLKLKLQYFGHLMWELAHLKRPWCWERLRAGGDGDDRGWDDWMASPTQWTWVWVGSGSWWWTGRPGVLRFRGSQRVGHDWETELTMLIPCKYTVFLYSRINFPRLVYACTYYLFMILHFPATQNLSLVPTTLLSALQKA